MQVTSSPFLPLQVSFQLDCLAGPTLAVGAPRAADDPETMSMTRLIDLKSLTEVIPLNGNICEYRLSLLLDFAATRYVF
jgi:hypothetical protein